MRGLPPGLPVVLMASAPWATAHPVNAHQVARRLAARGHPVLFVESTGLRSPAPLASRHDRGRIAARLRGFARGVRAVEPDLSLLSPLALPWGWPEPARRLSLWAVAASAARGARRLGMRRPLAWCFLPTHWRVPDALDACACVYHCVDDYAGNPGVDAAWVRRQEERMLARADRVFATSAALAERLAARRPDVVTVPNVADVALFARAVTERLPEPEALRGLPRPRAVYVGNLASYRVEPALLRAAADAVAPGCLVLVGEEGLGDVAVASDARATLAERGDVHRLGPRPQADLPAILAHCDVALVPFLDNAHTRGSAPLKLWEYLAAGLPVVARALPAFREAERAGLVRTAADPDAFGRAVREAAAEGRVRAGERLEAARGHDWEDRMDSLLAHVAGALDAEGAGGAGR